jgi:hypothetical protein
MTYRPALPVGPLNSPENSNYPNELCRLSSISHTRHLTSSGPHHSRPKKLPPTTLAAGARNGAVPSRRDAAPRCPSTVRLVWYFVPGILCLSSHHIGVADFVSQGFQKPKENEIEESTWARLVVYTYTLTTTHTLIVLLRLLAFDSSQYPWSKHRSL